MLNFKTAGESHGKGLIAIVEGLPAGIEVSIDYINNKLARRQGGYGRGGRMKIETDVVDIYSGIRAGKTMGSPVGILIHNKDWENWQGVMAAEKKKNRSVTSDNDEITIKKDGKLKKIKKVVTRPRPGHADLAGIQKYNTDDIRNILERASARETAARTAVGGLTDNFLRYFDIDIISHVIQLGEISVPPIDVNFMELRDKVIDSPLHCFNKEKEEEMMDYVDRIKEKGDSLGGIIEIQTTPLPVGLGSHTQWDRKLDGLLSRALMSIPAVKGVEIGPAFSNSTLPGSQVHDEIYYEDNMGYYRKTNRAGGIEGGVSNGQPLVIRIAMKPIPTLYKPLQSVDIHSKESFAASVERSDVTAVPACGVVGESMISFVLAQAILNKFGGDSIEETLSNFESYISSLR
ncbi:MAG: chorismate synthase [Halanaerobiales bacterium]